MTNKKMFKRKKLFVRMELADDTTNAYCESCRFHVFGQPWTDVGGVRRGCKLYRKELEMGPDAHQTKRCDECKTDEKKYHLIESMLEELR